MKKNLRKIPAEILGKLRTMKTNEIVAGCAVMYQAEVLLAGRLRHLGISIAPEGLVVPHSIVPPASQGKFSTRNIEGKVVIRKDLPKETHYNSIESPNWGDSSNGTHTVDLPYEKYPREFYPPRELEISITCN